MSDIMKSLRALFGADTGAEETRRLEERVAALERQMAGYRRLIAGQQQSMDALLAELRAVSDVAGVGGEIAITLEKEMGHEFDAFYVDFEDRFRGSREEIRKRLAVYQPFIDMVKGVPGNITFLDIGCGRGEWLELLQEQGCRGRGIDINRVALACCRERGFDVLEADVLEFLRGEESGSCGMLTGFHLMEHLPFDAQMHMLQEAFRVLQPGGLAIFETPDPENVIVGTCNFYIDPTHRNPLPDLTLAFMVEYCGFAKVEVLKLQQTSVPPETGNGHLGEVLRRFYMSRDYAVIGYKPLL